MVEAMDTPVEREDRGTFLLVVLSLGHTAIHWFQQLWPVIIPSVKASLGLSNVQLGTLGTVREFTTVSLMLPSGMLADFFRKRTAIILAAAFIFLGASYFLVAQASAFVWIIPGVALIGVGNALWHPAALSSISVRFPDRRASALAVHGVGASIGDTVGPIVIGLLLATLAWQRLLELHMIPALIIALLLWKFLGSIYGSQKGTRPSLESYLSNAKTLLRHRLVLAIMGVNTLTGMARLSVITFLPIYIQEDLGYSALGLGFFWGLLHAMGTVSQPVMGYCSDRFGRKIVLVPSLTIFGLLYLALSVADSGVQLIMVIGALGLFFYALATIILATVMDVASEQVQASMLGTMNVLTHILSLPSPIIAGILVTRYGTPSAFVFAGAVTLLGALLLTAIRVPSTTRPTTRTLA